MQNVKLILDLIENGDKKEIFDNTYLNEVNTPVPESSAIFFTSMVNGDRDNTNNMDCSNPTENVANPDSTPPNTPTSSLESRFPMTPETDRIIVSVDEALPNSDSELPSKFPEVNSDLTSNDIVEKKNFCTTVVDTIQHSKEEILRKLSQPETKFVGGLVVGKLLAAPILKYATDKINGEKSDSNIFSYFEDSLHNAIPTAIKSGLFYSINSIPFPGKHDAFNKMTGAKLAADGIYNLGKAVMHKTLDPIYKMASMDYAKELSLWLTIGSASKILSMTNANNVVDFNKIYQEHSFILGATFGASTEITDFTQAAFSGISEYFYLSE